MRGLQAEARKHGLPISVGIHEPTPAGDKVRNTSVWIDGAGEIVQRYQKLHLFDVAIRDGPQLQESRGVERGDAILPPFGTPVGALGMTICFDLRFPEISLALRRQGAQVLSFPSAFTVPTGEVHWEPLLRARAIETQSYVVAAAQVGWHNDTRRSHGHSMIVDPWGRVLAELGGDDMGPALLTADVDLDYLEKVRREMPLARRT